MYQSENKCTPTKKVNFFICSKYDRYKGKMIYLMFHKLHKITTKCYLKYEKHFIYIEKIFKESVNFTGNR